MPKQNWKTIGTSWTPTTLKTFKLNPTGESWSLAGNSILAWSRGSHSATAAVADDEDDKAFIITFSVTCGAAPAIGAEAVIAAS